MSTTFLNTITQNIGVTPTTVLSTIQTANFTVIGLNLANTTTSMIQVSAQLFIYAPNLDGTSNTSSVLSQGYIMKSVMLAPQSSMKIVTNSEKLILAGNNAIVITSNLPNSVDAIVSYVALA
jgi:hypothetical protein